MSGTAKTKGISAQIDPELHQAVRERREALGKTTDEYITMVLRADVDQGTITITLAPDLREEVEHELQRTESTMDELVALALQHELDHDHNKEENGMSEPTRTLAFQVSATTFYRVKDRLKELGNKSQKAYVLDLINADLDEADRQREARLRAEEPSAEEFARAEQDPDHDSKGMGDYGDPQPRRLEFPDSEEQDGVNGSTDEGSGA